jgi:ABC-type multidrug transport system ATPase subunit
MLKLDSLCLARGTSAPISFDLSPGGVIWVRGKNGSGKSTLLLTLIKEIQPISGKVSLNGSSLADIHEIEISQRISYAPQKADFSVELSVRRSLELLKVDPHSQLAKSLGLNEFLDQSLMQLSGGQEQRLLLALAFSREVELYLLDEPFASQDGDYLKVLISTIKEGMDQGKSFVITSHLDLEQIPEFSRNLLSIELEL